MWRRRRRGMWWGRPAGAQGGRARRFSEAAFRRRRRVLGDRRLEGSVDARLGRQRRQQPVPVLQRCGPGYRGVARWTHHRPAARTSSYAAELRDEQRHQRSARYCGCCGRHRTGRAVTHARLRRRRRLRLPGSRRRRRLRLPGRGRRRRRRWLRRPGRPRRRHPGIAGGRGGRGAGSWEEPDPFGDPADFRGPRDRQAGLDDQHHQAVLKGDMLRGPEAGRRRRRPRARHHPGHARGDRQGQAGHRGAHRRLDEHPDARADGWHASHRWAAHDRVCLPEDARAAGATGRPALAARSEPWGRADRWAALWAAGGRRSARIPWSSFPGQPRLSADDARRVRGPWWWGPWSAELAGVAADAFWYRRLGRLGRPGRLGQLGRLWRRPGRRRPRPGQPRCTGRPGRPRRRGRPGRHGHLALRELWRGRGPEPGAGAGRPQRVLRAGLVDVR
mmetsp:Transcript_161339/g.517953  ORF Transcript_161339/g.517953 Transcript_161339/m.517953 type:complete len:446 (-) Transcript_161339:2475-3812(-)